MSASARPGSAGRRQALKQLSGRVPLRIKLITAVLALVVIALTVISVASISLFRDYQLSNASQQVTTMFDRQAAAVRAGGGVRPGMPIYAGFYLIAMRPVGTTLGATPGYSIPNIPTTPSWLSANSGKLVDVPAVSGTDNWRVITAQVTYEGLTPFGPTTQRETLIVGVDLGDVNSSIGQLSYIDLIVSLIVVVALAIVGVAIVRTSLRPLTDIERTAEAIAAGDLSRRVPVHDRRTEVGRLARSLNLMLAQIESAFHARARSEAAAKRSEERMRQFVADASHELRTPLTAIQGYAEYYRQRGGLDNGSQTASEPDAEPSQHPAHIGTAPGTAASGTLAPGSAGSTASPGSPAAAGSAGGDGPAPAGMVGDSGHITGPDVDRIMERVEQESARMGGLVEDMLELARLDEQRPIERRPVDLLTLAADAVQDARVIAPDRKIELTVASGTAFLVLGDEARLRQVISNLMGNALTHTPEGTPVTVRILAGYQGNPAVPAAILEVADQGAGLTREQAEHVFERFYRADQARGRRTGGTGLGLAIVSALVAAHGGTVGVNTAPGQGATFWITLPLAPEATPDAP
jgi:two-component system, OmpR family, sensor kinase